MPLRTLLTLMSIPALLLPGCSRERKPKNNGTNVVLIVLDTVRRDRLSCYGYDRPTTPNIDAIAAHGVRFDNVYSNSSWTLPSHASLFTGMYPAEHRATQETLRLSEGPPTLAEVLSAAGYQTFGASTNGIVSSTTGLARGFDQFDEVFRSEFKEQVKGQPGHLNTIAFQQFLESSDRDRPFFAFFNYISAHLPYTPQEPFLSRLLEPGHSREEIIEAARMRMPDHYMYDRVTKEQYKILSQLYDGEIAFLDAHVADLWNVLDGDGRLANTLFIITADHGENIGDHGHFAHVFNMYNTLLEVPLIVVFPGGRGGGVVRTDNAQILDLFATIIAQCGVEYDAPPAGRDLFGDGAASVKAPLVAEYYYPRQVLSVFDQDDLAANIEKFIPYMRRMRTIQNGSYKLIWGSDGDNELYDIAADPDETRNLIGDDENPLVAPLLSQLDDIIEHNHGATPLDPTPEVGWMVPGFEEQIQDPEVLKRLRSLGYIK